MPESAFLTGSGGPPPPRGGDRRCGLLLGGSGLLGGTILHHFKTNVPAVEILAPNSKRVSLRNPADIDLYVSHFRPDFIINSALAAIDSSPTLAYEVNFLGTIHLAQAAIKLGIPYIHLSSAATLPAGEDLREEESLPLVAGLPNYPKSKLLAEKALARLHREHGLDYTVIRLAVVYGEHDHKIQGFHRLLFSVASGRMPVLLTRPGVRHSYSNAAKLPRFVEYILGHRQEFTGQTYHFVDQEPVEMVQIIRRIKATLRISRPMEVSIPFPVARFGQRLARTLVRTLNRLGIEARLPAELLFLREFYRTQTLSAAKLAASSFHDPCPEETVFTELPFLVEYYVTRWAHLNLISPYDRLATPTPGANRFLKDPAALLEEDWSRPRKTGHRPVGASS
ncbi:MAG: SDR family oxidoreductase [Thermodesulfobacteriota bacterium]